MKCRGLSLFLIKILSKNTPEALAKISTLIAKYNVSILSSIINTLSDKSKASIMSFLDFDKALISVNELVKKLMELDEVLGVEVVKPQFPGLVVNDLLYPISCLDFRCVLVHIDGIGKLLEFLYGKFGSAAKVLMYYAGYSSTKGIIKGLKRITGLKGLPLLRACLQLFQACGYGKFQVSYHKFMPASIVIKAFNLFECEPFKGKMREANSHIFRGVLACIIEEVTGKKAIVLEGKCIAKGDPYCQFIVKLQ